MEVKLHFAFVVFVIAVNTQAVPIAPLFDAANPKDKVQDEWLVLLNSETTKSAYQTAKELQKNYGDSIKVRNIFEMNRFKVIWIATDDISIQRLRRHADVMMIEANMIFHSTSQSSCLTQETGAELWGLSRITSDDLPDYSSAQYEYTESDGQGVDVYVLDSGINLKHEDFEGRAVWGMTATGLEHEGDEDLDGHGTHVAGTVGGKRFGVAKKAKLIAVKVLGKHGGTSVDILEGLIWIVTDFQQKSERLGHRAKAIINASLGSAGPYISHMRDMIVSELVNTGIQISIAAGNDKYDACAYSGPRVSEAITVGASAIDDTLAEFSNFGPCVDIVAPGHNILSAWIGNDTAKNTMSGTSMAAPHVTGMVARYLSQQREGMSPHDIKAWLLKQAVTHKLKFNMSDPDGEYSTPNRLLHAGCDLGILSAPQESKESTSAASILTYIMFPLVIIMFAAAMVMIGVKVIPWVKDKFVKRQDTAPYVGHQNEGFSQNELNTVT